MLSLFGSVKPFLHLSEVQTDNKVFQLHYKLTGAILLAFSILVTSQQYIGDPIDCVVDEIPQNVMDNYCWVYSTFTVPDSGAGRIGKDVVQPGVGPYVEGETDTKRHLYYQWVCFVLFFQFLLFQIPRYFWKMWEAGRLANLTKGLHGPIAEKKEEQKEFINKYFQYNKTHHNAYAYKFFFCEVLNFVNVVGQIFFMDLFLDGEFSNYGTDVVKFSSDNPELRTDPMSRVFPKITKCIFRKYGASGTVQRFDGLCVLPLNIVNEKIYIFLWFYFVTLAIISGIQLLVEIATFSMSKVRFAFLKRKCLGSGDDELWKIANEGSFGDWFLLNLMGSTIDPIVFKDVVKNVSEVITNESKKED